MVAEQANGKGSGLLGEKVVPPCLMTIFGASGDLTKRLLLPSIYNLAAMHDLPDAFRLLGFAMEDWTDEYFRDYVGQQLRQFWGQDADDAVVGWLQKRVFYQQGNFGDAAAFDALKTRIEAIEAKEQTGGNRLFYLAVAPSFIAPVAAQLSRTTIITEDGPCWRRLIIEKPFGHDLKSAIALNHELQSSLHEDQIYRIDHFAGKDAVQDLAVFRFSNTIIEPLWNRGLIDNVQITAAEIVGVEGRAGYYEKSGATRDMVPNHMCELLSLVAMEPPVSFTAEHMRDKQVELLASTRKIKVSQVDDYAVRGQYGAGSINGQPVVGYRQDKNVDPASNTETYMAMRVDIDNWRWSGVPFYLRTGKRLAKQATEIRVIFRKPPARLFPNRKDSNRAPNTLLFNLQPTQEIRLSFGAKAPGLTTLVDHESMDFKFPSGQFGDHGKGYERLLHDCMIGNTILFQRAEFVEQGWSLVEPLLEAWGNAPKEPFPNYDAGSAGPTAADDLLARAGHAWQGLADEADD